MSEGWKWHDDVQADRTANSTLAWSIKIKIGLLYSEKSSTS